MLLSVFLEFGALAGVPMRPEQVEELMQMSGRPKVAHVLPDDQDRHAGYPLRRGQGRRQRGRRRTTRCP